jgi:hypothetical protein
MVVLHPTLPYSTPAIGLVSPDSLPVDPRRYRVSGGDTVPLPHPKCDHAEVGVYERRSAAGIRHFRMRSSQQWRRPVPQLEICDHGHIAGFAYGKVFQKSSSVFSSAILHALINTSKHVFF